MRHLKLSKLVIERTRGRSNPFLNKWILALILICSLCFYSDTIGQPSLPQPYIFQADDGLVYDASFHFKEYFVSGLLVMKKQDEGYHVVLLAKMGPTLMDFIITDDSVIWKKAIKTLDKPLVLKEMEKDFRILLLTPLYQPTSIKQLNANRFRVKKAITLKVETSEDGRRITTAKTKRFANLFKTFVTYLYTDGDDVPDQIKLKHRTIKLKIELNQLEQ
jgi:hypothetical protein